MSRAAPADRRHSAAAVKAAIDALGDPDRALHSAGFFKTAPGQYGEGDRFVGVTVPAQRRVARQFRGLDRDGVRTLLDSDVHEHRLTGLFLLRSGFEKAATAEDRQAWVDFYLQAVFDGRVNNWDLVDSSAEYILGASMVGHDFDGLLDLVAEKDLWRRRVAIIATAAFIKNGDAAPILELAPRILDDHRDLIQKAVGWMLREMGKRVDRALLLDFLEDHAAQMGRTALSYATEHLEPGQRAHYRGLR
ncbi:DNA alkylation repair protein [Nocardia sp. 348MFTsu5.1]|uniref:DNA alkylation repair protein n=1 Tax=Nocardia sp. 348MFTsu5.1 TaxID=1172185 RepID=UPI00037A989B|nr:DNA alkylation repair protein [Nocardia sp. 348MFTsu5.1]